MEDSRVIVDCPLNKSTINGGRRQQSPPKFVYDCKFLLPKYIHPVYLLPTKVKPIIYSPNKFQCRSTWSLSSKTQLPTPLPLASASKAKYSWFKLFRWWFITTVLSLLCRLPLGYLACLFQAGFELLENRVHSIPSISCPAPWGHHTVKKHCLLQYCLTAYWTLRHTAFCTVAIQKVRLEKSSAYQFLPSSTKQGLKQYLRAFPEILRAYI